jgi:phosphotransferase system, enzyme I, PtsP
MTERLPASAREHEPPAHAKTAPRKQDSFGAAARRLIARLRDVMAGGGSAQERLDRIVQLIAAELHAEVCSCYLMRAGDILELFATVGLNPSAVHRTRLRVGEGLVGTIAASARPLALGDAPAHPSFAYRPETGEEPFRSLAGVPLLRGGRVRGVLVIQHVRARAYSEDEIETLQTVAMVLAELSSTGELVGAGEISSAGDAYVLQQRLAGIGMNAGLAMGQAVLHRPRLTLSELVADDPEAEFARFGEAVNSMHASIDDMVQESREAVPGDTADILESYRMFARDRGWLGRIREAIAQGLTAEAAVERVQQDNRARMSQIADPYLRARLDDLEDLTNRLLRHLTGKRSPTETRLPDDVVLVARALGPAELLDYDRSRLRALVLEEGSPSSHVAIVARALDIPVVGRCSGALTRIEQGDPLIVDGDNGQVLVRPGEDLIDAASRAMATRADRRLSYHAVRDLPAVTRDAEPIQLCINAGLVIEIPQIAATGAEGIGLFRTEIPFMVRAAYPDVAAQTALYREVLDQANGAPVTFRTLDVGGDKTLPYFPAPDEENPALGWRAIRIGLDRPAMLRMQLRALVRAAAGHELRVKFPLVAEVAEFDQARRLLDRELAKAVRDGLAPPSNVKVGLMLEVPALLWQLDTLLKSIDFLSVGSNDLLQYLFAADRNNPRVGARYDSLTPSFLSVLDRLAERCRAARVPLSVCGEMASRPLEAMALIGLGIRVLSMTPHAVGPIKAMVRSIDARQVAEFLKPLLTSRDHSLRPKLRAFARDHGASIEDIALVR